MAVYPFEFRAERVGWRWHVVMIEGDTTRRTWSGKFWRWISAERVAGALTQFYRTGFDMGREHQLEADLAPATAAD